MIEMVAVLVGVVVLVLVAEAHWRLVGRPRLQAKVRDLQLHPETARAGVATYDGTSPERTRHDVPLTMFEARFRARIR